MDRLREEEQVELGGTSPILKIPQGKEARPHATRISRSRSLLPLHETREPHLHLWDRQVTDAW